MKSFKKIKSFKIVTLFFLLVAFLMTNYFLFQKVDYIKAQTLNFLAQIIGGQTEGVSGLCCNGVKLSFTSADPSHIFLLDGEALYTPVLTQSYQHGNEFTQGYNTIGKLMPGICLEISEDCAPGEPIPQILLIGTSPSPELSF